MSLLPNMRRCPSCCRLIFRLALLLLIVLPGLPAHAAGPVISNGQLSAASLPATGGTLTVTATVTDASSTVATVTAAYVNADGRSLGTIDMQPTGTSGGYSGDLNITPNDGLNTNFTVTILAVDQANVSTTATVGTFTQPSADNGAIIFQNQSTGGITAWSLYDLNDRAYITHSLDLNWKVVAFADFNGDNQRDILLENQSTGALICWYMNGAVIADRKYGPRLPSADWKVVGVGDFNNDTKNDLLLWNPSTNLVSVWFLDGLSRTGGAYVTSIPSGWTVVGAGDFNGDTSPDLLLQNPTTAAISTYLLSGTTVTDRQYIYPTPATADGHVSPNWHVVGVITVGSGFTVIGFQNQASGAVSYWILQGLALADPNVLGFDPTGYLLYGLDPNWKVAAIPITGGI